MGHSSGVVDVLTILLWATFLPIIVVLVLRRKDTPDDASGDAHNSIETLSKKADQASKELSDEAAVNNQPLA